MFCNVFQNGKTRNVFRRKLLTINYIYVHWYLFELKQNSVVVVQKKRGKDDKAHSEAKTGLL